MEHEAKATETKPTAEFGKPVTLYRIPCSCGWVGMWRGSEELARKSRIIHLSLRQRDEFDRVTNQIRDNRETFGFRGIGMDNE